VFVHFLFSITPHVAPTHNAYYSAFLHKTPSLDLHHVLHNYTRLVVSVENGLFLTFALVW